MKIKSLRWQKRFLDLARTIAGWSKDQSTKTGSVIVDPDGRIVSAGFNGPPVGIDDDRSEIHERPEKYFWFEHAERNAIYSSRTPVEGCVIYVTHMPCADCARAIIQNRLSCVVVDTRNTEHGADSMFYTGIEDTFRAAREMLTEAEIEIIEYRDTD